MPDQDPLKYFGSEVKRLNYYNSQFLVAEDFNDEQLYHNQMRRLHNRSLHTWGVVRGLEVSGTPGAARVAVAPGIAIDRLGRELVLPAQPDPIGLGGFDANSKVYVTVGYAEVVDPADRDEKAAESSDGYHRRWTERPKVSASAAAPAADAPEVLLAVVTLDRDKSVAAVDVSARRYAGSRFGSSNDGKEFSLYADAAGAWHFFDGAKGADRLTVDAKGSVGIGTAPTAARLSVLTSPGPYDGALADFVVGGNYRLSLRSRSPARDTVAYHFDLVNNLGRFDDFLVLDRGNVGIGTTSPISQLHIRKDAVSALGPVLTLMNGAGSGGAGGAIDFDGYDPSTRSGYDPLTGSPTARIQSLDDGQYSSALLFLSKEPGANGNALRERMRIGSAGNVGIGTTNPLGPLSVGDSSVAGSDGYIVIGKRNTAGGTRHFRIGFDADFNFTIGDYGYNNGAGTWASPFAVSYSAPSKSLYINSGGNVGVGRSDPQAKLHVAGEGRFDGNIKLGRDATFSTENRMHIDGGELLYLLNKSGVIVSKAWQGNGNLLVEGNITVNGSITIGDWKLETRVDGAWGSQRSVLYISFQGMDVARFGTYQDMFQIKRFSNATGKPTGSYFYVNVNGPGNT